MAGLGFGFRHRRRGAFVSAALVLLRDLGVEPRDLRAKSADACPFFVDAETLRADVQFDQRLTRVHLPSDRQRRGHHTARHRRFNRIGSAVHFKSGDVGHGIDGHAGREKPGAPGGEQKGCDTNRHRSEPAPFEIESAAGPGERVRHGVILASQGTVTAAVDAQARGELPRAHRADALPAPPLVRPPAFTLGMTFLSVVLLRPKAAGFYVGFCGHDVLLGSSTSVYSRPPSRWWWSSCFASLAVHFVAFPVLIPVTRRCGETGLTRACH